MGGFTEAPARGQGFGSLMLGAYDGDRLVYAGRVGTGFDDATLATLRERLDTPRARRVALRRCRPTSPGTRCTGSSRRWSSRWPFREWTAEGHLRQPVFLGVREDKAPHEIVREVAEADGVTDNSAPSDAEVTAEPAPADTAAANSRPIDVLGVRVTNPDKRLFPESPFGKVDFANYYAAIAPLMLAETADRPLTLVRCPVGHGRGCFYQRHPDKGSERARPHARPHAQGRGRQAARRSTRPRGSSRSRRWARSKSTPGSRRADAPTRPDRIVFDLDPGEGVGWPQIRVTALLVAEECRSARVHAATSSPPGSKGLHVVLPDRAGLGVRADSRARQGDRRSDRFAPSGRAYHDHGQVASGPAASTSTICATPREQAPSRHTRRVTCPDPPCAVPLAWDELTDELDICAFTPGRVLERANAGVNPWADLPDQRPDHDCSALAEEIGVGPEFAHRLGELAHLARGGLGQVLADHEPQRAHQVLGHLAPGRRCSSVSGVLPIRLLSTSTDTDASTDPMTGRSVSSTRMASALATSRPRCRQPWADGHRWRARLTERRYSLMAVRTL